MSADDAPFIRRTPRKPPTPAWVWLVLAAVVVAGGIWFATPHIDRYFERTDANRRPTRAEFRERVVGKTPDEVIEAVGRPDSTAENDGPFFRSARWEYRRRTVDPATGRVDPVARVEFRNGVAVGVDY